MKDFTDISIVDLAGIVANHLASHDIQVVLVGGLAVEVYTLNRYLTADIDMVDINYSSPSKLREAMAEIGFLKEGKVFVNPTTDVSVEFPSAPLAVGDEQIKDVTTCQTPYGDIAILHAIDVVKDRLLAYLHWSDNQSAVQAIAIALSHSIDISELESFFASENEVEKGKIVVAAYHKSAEMTDPAMEDIEAILIQQLVASR